MESSLVRLITCDNKTIQVDVAVAKESGKVKNIIEEMDIVNFLIPLEQVSGDTLEKVMEYCTYHVESRKTSEDKPATPEDEIKAWDAEFVKVLDHNTLRALIKAARYLEIKNLLKLTTQGLVDAQYR